MDSYRMQRNGRIVVGVMDALDNHGETDVNDIVDALSVVHSLSPFQVLSLLAILHREGIIGGTGETLIPGVDMLKRVHLTTNGKKMLEQQKTMMGDPSRN